MGKNIFGRIKRPKDFIIKGGVLIKYKGKHRNVVIPDGVVSVGKRAFYECRHIQSVTVPESVISLEEESFCFCSGLRCMVLPDSIISVESNSFRNCTSLVSVTVPKRVESIRCDEFYGCVNLQHFTVFHRTFPVLPAAKPKISVYDMFGFGTLYTNLRMVLEMIHFSDFDLSFDETIRYPVIVLSYHYTDNSKARDYIVQKMPDIMKVLIEMEDTECIKMILHLIGKHDMDKCIGYAAESGKEEIYILLLNYKNETFGFEVNDKKFDF